MSFIPYISTSGAPKALPHRPDVTTPLHSPTPRPFEPRAFKRREFEASDVYGFDSLKENRPIEVDGLPAVAVALALECNPRIQAFTERPRYLKAGDATVELDFWVRHVTGYEEYLLLVGDGDCIGVSSGAPRPREAERLQSAALTSGINLKFVVETDVREAGVQIAVHNRLLAFAQVAQSLPNRLALRQRVFDFIKSAKRVRIDQLEVAMSPLHSAEVQAVACELVCVGLLDLDREVELTRNSVLELAGAP